MFTLGCTVVINLNNLFRKFCGWMINTTWMCECNIYLTPVLVVGGGDDDDGFLRPSLRLIRLMLIPRSHLERRRYLTTTYISKYVCRFITRAYSFSWDISSFNVCTILWPRRNARHFKCADMIKVPITI